jgi:hypothetical protein
VRTAKKEVKGAQSLILHEDLKARKKVLRRLDYLGEDSVVTLKVGALVFEFVLVGVRVNMWVHYLGEDSVVTLRVGALDALGRVGEWALWVWVGGMWDVLGMGKGWGWVYEWEGKRCSARSGAAAAASALGLSK